MAIDLVGELIGDIVEGVAEMVFHGARGWNLFFRIIIFFVVIPLIIFGLYCLFT